MKFDVNAMVENIVSPNKNREMSTEMSEMEMYESIAGPEEHGATLLAHIYKNGQAVQSYMEESVGDKAKAGWEAVKKFLLKAINFVKKHFNKLVKAIKGLFSTNSYKGLEKLKKDIDKVLKKAKTPKNLDKKIKIQVYNIEELTGKGEILPMSDTLKAAVEVLKGDEFAETPGALLVDASTGDLTAIKDINAEELKEEITDLYEEWTDKLDIDKEEKDASAAYNELVTRLKAASSDPLFVKGSDSIFKEMKDTLKKLEKSAGRLDKTEKKLNKLSGEEIGKLGKDGDDQQSIMKKMTDVQISASKTISAYSQRNTKAIDYASKVANIVKADLNVVRAKFVS